MVIHFFRLTVPDFAHNWFRLIHYLSIKSFLVNNESCEVHLHFNNYPDSSNWFRLLFYEFGDRIKKVRIPVKSTETRTGLDKEKSYQVAHFIDQIAAETLFYDGGLVVDMDMICLKSLESMYEYLKPGKLLIQSELEYFDKFPIGLGVGFMASRGGVSCEPLREYLLRRLDYNIDSEWTEFSCDLMMDLYKTEKYRPYFKLVPQKEVDPFGPQYPELQDLFLHRRALPPFCKCIHVSESVTWDSFLKHLSVEHIMTVDTTFTLAVRKFIPPSVWTGGHSSINLY